MQDDRSSRGLYLALISIHGLLRYRDMELGLDADTGGQIKYVVELTNALSQRPEVERVDVLTRRIVSKRVDPIYAEPVERINDKAQIVRITCGPRRYLRKESLWPYLDSFIDQTLIHFRNVKRSPDIIHGHYADAGYVGSLLASTLGVPFIFTGHSLGRVKKMRLLEKGLSEESLEKRFNFHRRIEAEETALDTAALVVASSNQEIEQQYQLYDNYEPQRMEVIPPGVDLSRFSPPQGNEFETKIFKDLNRFLNDPKKPMVLAIARPDVRKNFPTLIKAFAECKELRAQANLVLVAGNRDDLTKLDNGARRVLRNIFFLIDHYDLYGSVAFPKSHQPGDIPDLYRLAAKTGGVFVNPALTEPFGLTLIEAAASGLPIVGPEDGGPRDIIGECQNGFLVDPLDSEKMGQTILDVVQKKEDWKSLSTSGIKNSRKRYSWSAHVTSFLREIEHVFSRTRPGLDEQQQWRNRLPMVDRMLLASIDDTLTGNPEGVAEFVERLKYEGDRVGFGVATGRRPLQAVDILRSLGVMHPDILIARAGTEIYYGRRLVPDRTWQRHIDYQWKPESVRQAIRGFRGLKLQPESEQSQFKISYVPDRDEAPRKRAVLRYLRQHGLRVNVVYCYQSYVDILPLRASIGSAIRYLTFKWGLPPERWLTVGYSGCDEEMLSGDTLGVVVGHYRSELKHLRGKPRIYFAEKDYVEGLLEGIDYYDFFRDVSIPGEEEDDFSTRRISTEAP